jgi:Domain of unknown function (DUF4833)
MNKTFGAVIFFLLMESAAAAQFAQPLFSIEHSSNKNKLYYEARTTKDGAIDAHKPIHAYWIMWEKDSEGTIREELTLIEKRMAYGFKIIQEPNKKYLKMNLVSFPERAIKVYQNNGNAVAEVSINGQPAYLEKIFINTRETLTLPKVNYIELFGTDKKTGEQRDEKVVPNKK